MTYLGSVGVGTGISHGQNARTSVGQLEVLVGELLSVDGLPAGAVEVGEVSTLAHEIRNHAVETTALEMERLARICQYPSLLLYYKTIGGNNIQ